MYLCMSNGSSDNKINDLKEEFKLIHESISKWDNYSLSIKNWAITVWSAIIVFIITQYYTQKASNIDLSNLFWIPIFLPIPFWFFDGLFKHFQRISVIRSQAIQDYLNNESLLDLDKKDEEKLKKMIEKFNEKSQENEIIDSVKKKFKNDFPIYDPVGRISRNFPFFIVKYHKKLNIFACLIVRIVAFVYCILLFLNILIISIVINCFIILWYLFIPIAIAIISWTLSHYEIV